MNRHLDVQYRPALLTHSKRGTGANSS